MHVALGICSVVALAMLDPVILKLLSPQNVPLRCDTNRARVAVPAPCGLSHPARGAPQGPGQALVALGAPGRAGGHRELSQCHTGMGTGHRGHVAGLKSLSWLVRVVQGLNVRTQEGIAPFLPRFCPQFLFSGAGQTLAG